MDNDLLTTARTLAERGWLPGIEWDDVLQGIYPKGRSFRADEADILLAAHREIVRRGWTYEIRSDGWTTVQTPCFDEDVPWETHKSYSEQGTDTTALLRCLLAACVAAEKKEDTNDG